MLRPRNNSFQIVSASFFKKTLQEKTLPNSINRIVTINKILRFKIYLHHLVCYVYKIELEASANVTNSLLLKSTKYDWARDAHQLAIQKREFMANILFDQLCNFDSERYYYSLYTSALEEQISRLISDVL